MLLSVLTLFFEVQQIHFLCFNTTYPGKCIFQNHTSSAILIHCLEEMFLWVQVWCATAINKRFQGWLAEYLLHFSVLEKAILIRSPFFGCQFFCPYYRTQTESNKTLCNQDASQGREQWPLNTHKFSNYIFHPKSFPKVVSYFHMTLSCQQQELVVQIGIYSRCVEVRFLSSFLESLNKRHSDRVRVKEPL